MTPCIITLQFASDTKFGRAPARTGWQSTKWTTMSSNSYRTIRCRMWPRGSYHHAANVCWGHYCASCRTCSRLVHTSTRIQLYFVFIRIRSKERTRLVVLCDCFQMHTHQEDMFQVEYVLFGLRCDWFEWIPKVYYLFPPVHAHKNELAICMALVYRTKSTRFWPFYEIILYYLSICSEFQISMIW